MGKRTNTDLDEMSMRDNTMDQDGDMGRAEGNALYESAGIFEEDIPDLLF